MNIQELIDILSKIENKQTKLLYQDDDGYLFEINQVIERPKDPFVFDEDIKKFPGVILY